MKDKGTPELVLQLEVYYLLLRFSGLVKDKKDMAAKLGYHYIHISNVFSGKLPLADKFIAALEGTFSVPFRSQAQKEMYALMQRRVNQVQRSITLPAH